MVEISLRGLGGVALVDATDVAVIERHTWYAVAPDRDGPGRVYAMAKPYVRGTRRQPTVWMHRLLMAPAPGLVVDHRDGNGLNNCRANLRLCTQSQNNANMRVVRSATGYKGVYRGRNGRIFAAYQSKGRSIRIGAFDTAEAAAKAYDEAVAAEFGEFAATNRALGLLAA